MSDTNETVFSSLPLQEFTRLLASSDAVPGGGGASAAVGALAASLGAMVGSLTVDKKTYADVETDIRILMAQAEKLRCDFLRHIDADAAAFRPLSRAYSMPKDAPGRDNIMEACLRRAADAPMEILKTCCECVSVLEGFAEKGSRMVASDAATGAVLCQAAMYGAAINVRVNTKLMKMREYADEVNAEVDRRIREYCPRCEKVYADIYRRYC